MMLVLAVASPHKIMMILQKEKRKMKKKKKAEIVSHEPLLLLLLADFYGIPTFVDSEGMVYMI
jgi:hypothetical protein